jgi:hypothetical protein
MNYKTFNEIVIRKQIEERYKQRMEYYINLIQYKYDIFFQKLENISHL